MPITIEYQPSLVAAGQLAYDAGRGQYLQERDRFGLASAQLGEQARQFDQRLQFAAQESRLRDSQFRDQLGQQAWQFGAQHQQRQQGMYADLMRQQMVQEGYAQHAQTQYDIAVMQQDARAAEQQMVMGRQQALTEQQALQRYIQDNRGVLSPQQVADLQAQFEQRHGMPMGFDASAAIEAQRAVEETAMRRRAAWMSEMFDIKPEAAEEMLFVNPETGSLEMTSVGKAAVDLRQKEMDNRRLLEIAKSQNELDARKLDIQERANEVAQQSNPLERVNTINDQYAKAMAAYQKAVQDQAKRTDGGFTAASVNKGDFAWPAILSPADEMLVPPDVPYRRPDGLWIKNSKTGKLERYQ
jgi:hypothetical protein